MSSTLMSHTPPPISQSHCPSSSRSVLRCPEGISSNPKDSDFGRILYAPPVIHSSSKWSCYCVQEKLVSCDVVKEKITRSKTLSVRMIAPVASSAKATANTSDCNKRLSDR